MQNCIRKTRTMVLGGITTALLLIDVAPGQDLPISPFELGVNDREEASEDPAQDREALEAFYHATGGDEWKNNDGWLTDAPLKDWYGIGVSRGRVFFLGLEDNNLKGEIPKDIFLLDNLSELDLRWNFITGGLENLTRMSELSYLRLSANQFSGQIPASIEKMTKLRTLDLSENQFSGTIPTQIGELLRLEVFTAHSNELTGKLPEELCYPHNLKRIVLSQNQLSGSIVETVMNCISLRHLNLANNQFEGSIPEELTSSEQMNWLDLRGNKFDDDEQPIFRINFPGLNIQPVHVDKLYGLSMWGRGSFVSTSEESSLASVKFFNAVSIENGLLKLDEERVSANSVDRLKKRIDNLNSYLEATGTRVSTLSDFERSYAGEQKHAFLNKLKELDARANIQTWGIQGER
ncbi:MAG: hypothetical protein F4W92_08120 [Gammaproteobacteria bacterium]|nr:hypothetical protein [Gammaproteobacteria bacterium]